MHVGKLSTGFFAVPSLTMVTFMQMGWAMEGRGEFSFLIADQASEEGTYVYTRAHRCIYVYEFVCMRAYVRDTVYIWDIHVCECIENN